RRHTRFSRDWSSDVCSSDLSHYMSGNDYSGLSGNFSVATWGGDPEAIGKRVEVEYYMAFNLTEAFGRGNEPTKEEIDKLLLDIEIGRASCRERVKTQMKAEQ